MLYRILLFSVKPQHESAIGIHISPPFWHSLSRAPPPQVVNILLVFNSFLDIWHETLLKSYHAHFPPQILEVVTDDQKKSQVTTEIPVNLKPEALSRWPIGLGAEITCFKPLNLGWFVTQSIASDIEDRQKDSKKELKSKAIWQINPETMNFT